jgi:hypothetical protein
MNRIKQICMKIKIYFTLRMIKRHILKHDATKDLYGISNREFHKNYKPISEDVNG